MGKVLPFRRPSPRCPECTSELYARGRGNDGEQLWYCRRCKQHYAEGDPP